MKRLFSNKSGFSLAEIIVAIAVFAVMMAMIMQMLQLSIAQRNANYEFAADLAKQQDDLVVQGKDMTIPDDALGNPDIDDTLRINFIDPEDPTKILFKDDAGNAGLAIGYKVKTADPSADPDSSLDVNNGLNYFVGDFDYTADGIHEPGADGNGNGASQTDRYDARITGTKGMKDITVSLSKVSSVPKTTLSAGQTAYQFTVNANCTSMQNDDKRYAQMRLYFYSSTDYKIKKVEVPKKKADGTPDLDADGKQKVDTYYKKVYDKADLVKVVDEDGKNDGNPYKIDKSADYAVRLGLPLDGSKSSTAFNSDIVFYAIFNGDPQLTMKSFHDDDSSTFNRAPKIDEQSGTVTGTHVNIYGAKEIEVHDKKEDFK